MGHEDDEGEDVDVGADADALTAARLFINLHYLVRHEDEEAVARRTGIELHRIHAILTFKAYPDGYEIARIQQAYQQRVWPGTEDDPFTPINRD